MTEPVKPCPFCKGEVIEQADGDIWHRRLVGCIVRDEFSSPEHWARVQEIGAWNRRATEQTPSGEQGTPETLQHYKFERMADTMVGLFEGERQACWAVGFTADEIMAELVAYKRERRAIVNRREGLCSATPHPVPGQTREVTEALRWLDRQVEQGWLDIGPHDDDAWAHLATFRAALSARHPQ